MSWYQHISAVATPVSIPRSALLEVRDRCLCVRAQRAARRLARRFDRAFAPLGLTNGQFSLMVALTRPGPRDIGSTAELLAMDRTTLTAALKPLERRGLAVVEPDPDDRRARRLSLTEAGLALLQEALPIWTRTHAELDAEIGAEAVETLTELLDRAR